MPKAIKGIKKEVIPKATMEEQPKESPEKVKKKRKDKPARVSASAEPEPVKTKVKRKQTEVEGVHKAGKRHKVKRQQS
jgi:hypothetical protein